MRCLRVVFSFASWHHDNVNAMARSGQRQIERFSGTAMSGHRPGRWVINTATAHNAHHAKGRYNCGYYFLVRDTLMGTLDPRPGPTRSVKTASTAG